jgi:glycosyltransferase involved in cell wall biosynthesis
MRILYLSAAPLPPPSHPGGACTHIREVVRALEQRGHQVRLVAGTGAGKQALLTPAPPRLRRLVPATVRNLRREWLERRHDGQLFAHALRVAPEFRPDLIYERTSILHLTGVRLARELGLPLVVEQNSPEVEQRMALTGMASPGLAARIDRITCRSADAVVTVSTAMREYLIRLGARPETTYVVPNAARTELFDPRLADRVGVRRRLGLPDAAVVAGFVGVFADWHGLDQLVQAFALAQDGGARDMRLLVVGDGEQRGLLEGTARRLGISDRVLFPGLVPFEQVPDTIAAMDICVVSRSTWYGLPIKLFEYGAMGRAIIAPDRGPIREVMADREEGLIVPPESPEALAAALTLLADDPALRQQLGERFRQRVLTQYSWDRVADRLISICDDVLRTANSPEPRARGDAHGAPAEA